MGCVQVVFAYGTVFLVPSFGFTKTSFCRGGVIEMTTFIRHGDWFLADFYLPIFIFLNHI